MPTPKQFHKLVEKLKLLIEEDKERQFATDQLLANDRIDAIHKLKSIYPEAVRQAYTRYITPFLDRYAFLQKTSVLTVIKKYAYEPAHTQILAYLFQQDKSVLLALIQSVDDLPRKENLLRFIQESDKYEVYPEKKIENCGKISGRILDLLIIDHKNRWLLTIENKIQSCFSDGRIGKTQIDDYRIYTERKFREYEKFYLVISFTNDNENEALSRGWGFCNYNNIFNAVIQNTQLNHIAEDYLCALLQLLCKGTHCDVNYTLSLEQIAPQLSSIRQFYEQTILKLQIAL